MDLPYIIARAFALALVFGLAALGWLLLYYPAVNFLGGTP